MANGAIEKTEGACVVLAGAGTGKTYTIIEKIKHLISEGIYSPEKIVCITFSNEAANELLTRVRKFVKLDKDKEPIIRTFHAFSADLLRKHGEKIGINEKFKILTPDDAKVVLHRHLGIVAGRCHKYISTIGTAKDLGISLNELEEFSRKGMSEFSGIDIEKRLESLNFELQTLHLHDENSRERKRELRDEIARVGKVINLDKFVKAWRAYEKLKEKYNYQDYSDLNQNALQLVAKDVEIADEFDYFVVDEFQDTNKLQLDLLLKLAVKGGVTIVGTENRKFSGPTTSKERGGVMIVGDFNQSIYRFRGAYHKNFDEFKEKFGVGEKEIFNLDKSFRSSNKILRAAHQLILNNYENKDDCFPVWNSEDREGDAIEVHEMKNAREEARKVVELINGELQSGTAAEEICVMFRTHQQGRIIRKTLEGSEIEFCSVTKASLLRQESVKTAVDYLVILDKILGKKKGGEQAWWDLVYHHDFIEEDLIKIGKFIKDVSKEGDRNLSTVMLANLSEVELSSQGKIAAKNLVDRIKILLDSKEKKISEIVKDVFFVSGMLREGSGDRRKEAMLNLNKFYEIAQNHEGLYGEDLAGFIYYLEILDDLGIEVAAAELENRGVRLMTLHSTKGLEFDTVIITNLAQKRLPMEKMGGNELLPVELSPELRDRVDGMDRFEKEYFFKEYEKRHQLFDERRLCYVAFTRARKKLILSYALEYGGRKFYPSQFLQEVDYQKNGDFNFAIDSDRKYKEPGLEVQTGLSFSRALGLRDFDDALLNVVKNSVEEKKEKEIVFSPSSLSLFSECEKRYEYKYVFNMPEGKPKAWEAMRLGSFVHGVLDAGVKSGFKSLKEFLEFAHGLHLKGDWETVNLEDAEHLIKVFYERNCEKYSSETKTEQKLNFEIAGMKFTGFADRIDFNSDGLEIIDYKTGKGNVPPRARNWQLGYYALAASKLGKVKRVTLEMLKQEKPLEFELDDKGNAKSVNGLMEFNIYEVEGELVQTAHAILEGYKSGFKACGLEKNCDFCNEYVYGL
tara:strand:- start:4415 stop:7480 length:3066 start_codon:yes stop_codon:yes gene_type:complete